jgi:hypothetical protein
MAEILFGLSEADAQLELQEKHYEKLKVYFCSNYKHIIDESA